VLLEIFGWGTPTPRHFRERVWKGLMAKELRNILSAKSDKRVKKREGERFQNGKSGTDREER
jgi:hypothetical protein